MALSPLVPLTVAARAWLGHYKGEEARTFPTHSRARGKRARARAREKTCLGFRGRGLCTLSPPALPSFTANSAPKRAVRTKRRIRLQAGPLGSAAFFVKAHLGAPFFLPSPRGSRFRLGQRPRRTDAHRLADDDGRWPRKLLPAGRPSSSPALALLFCPAVVSSCDDDVLAPPRVRSWQGSPFFRRLLLSVCTRTHES